MASLRNRLLGLLVLVPGLAVAQDVRLAAPDDGIAVEGRLLEFDGEVYRVDTVYGELTLDASRVACDGAGCPDLESFAPEVTLSGSAAIGGLLLPALIEGFADRIGHSAERLAQNDARFAYVLTDTSSGRPAIRFSFRLSTSDEGFADLLAGEADLALSSREINNEELARAAGVGLGNLERRGRATVISLDGLVAITGTGNPVDRISMQNLARVYSGQITSWAGLGGADTPIVLHTRDPASSVAKDLEDRILRRYGLKPFSEINRHRDNKSLADAVAADPRALGFTVFSERGTASSLALIGPCGLPVPPSVESLKTGDYPLTSPNFVYLPARRLPKVARDFLSYVQSPAAALIVRRAGFVDTQLGTIPIDRQGLRMANAIRQLGRGVELTDLQAAIDRLIGAERLTASFRTFRDETDLNAQSQSNLELLVEAIERGMFDDRVLIFAGFGDGQGDSAQDRHSSERHARFIRDAVVSKVTAQDATRVRFETVGFGNAMPVACDEVDWGRSINRRVEVWLR